MLENPKHELFAQAVIKHKGHLSRAYYITYGVKGESARHGGSALWKKVEIQARVNELLEAQGLGIVEIIKSLKKIITHGGRDTKNGFIYDDYIRLEALKIALRLHGLLGHKSGMAELYPSPEQLEQIEKSQERLIEEEE